jgi:hypothetical protein
LPRLWPSALCLYDLSRSAFDAGQRQPHSCVAVVDDRRTLARVSSRLVVPDHETFVYKVRMRIF